MVNATLPSATPNATASEPLVSSHAIPQCEKSHLDKAAVVGSEVNNKKGNKNMVLQD